MHSITKNRLDEDSIKKLVEHHFGDDWQVKEIKELEAGMFNAAYLIVGNTTSVPKDMVLKIGVKPDKEVMRYEKDIMISEIEALKLLDQKEGILVPELYAYDTSRRIIDSDYIFMETYKGESMFPLYKKIDKENLVSVKKQLARVMAQMHKIKGDHFGYSKTRINKQFDNWKDAFLDMFDMLIEDAMEKGVKLPFKKLNQILDMNKMYLDDVLEPSFVDYDIWLGNIFLTKNGDLYELEGIIDFERSFFGDPLADFVSLIHLFYNVENDKKFWSEYCESYGRDTEITLSERQRILLYEIYLYSILMVETFRYSRIYGFFQKAWAKHRLKKAMRRIVMEK